MYIMPLHVGLSRYYTKWFLGSTFKPVHVGPYQTSYARGIRMVGSYSMWDGTRWRPYGKWADYSGAAGFVWRGLSRKPSARMAHTTARILA